jgi:hypothetical protein
MAARGDDHDTYFIDDPAWTSGGVRALAGSPVAD